MMMPAAPLVVVMLFAPTILIMIFVMMAAATALFLVIVMMAPATAFFIMVMVVMTSATAFFIMIVVVMAPAAALFIMIVVVMAPALAVMMMVSATAARLLFFGLGKRLGNKRSHNGLGFQTDTGEHGSKLLIFHHGKAVLGFGIPYAARGKCVGRFLKHPGISGHAHQAVRRRLNHIKPAFFINEDVTDFQGTHRPERIFKLGIAARESLRGRHTLGIGECHRLGARKQRFGRLGI